MLTTIHRSALLMHSAGQMYDLVNDVESYPSFMDGCTGAEILQQEPGVMVARLDLAKGKLRYSFSTRNSLKEADSIMMTLEEGPLASLSGGWTFTALTENACKTSLALEFEFSSVTAGLASSSLFNSVANNLLDSIVKRAESIYGKNYV